MAPVEGLSLFVRSTGTNAQYRNATWEIGALRGDALVIGDVQVVGTRAAAIASPTGGTIIDAEARTAVEAILNALRGHGLIEI